MMGMRRRDCLLAVPAAAVLATLPDSTQAQPRARATAPPEIVRELVYNYCRGLDRLDPELLRSCFHDDATIDLGTIYQGTPDGFIDVAMRFMGGVAATRHLVGNVLRVGDGYESYVDAWHLIQRDGAWRELIVRGRYLQRVTSRSSRWAFSFHSEVVDYGTEQASDRNWFGGPIGMPRGTRDQSDGSVRLLTAARS